MVRLLTIFWFVWGGFAYANQSGEDAHAQFKDVTVRFDERSGAHWGSLSLDGVTSYRALPEHSRQYVVYFDLSGQAFVWVPGRPFVFQTAWDYTIIKARKKGQPADQAWVSEISALCFDQFWTNGKVCRTLHQLKQSIAEAVGGDVFDLRSRTEPCRLCRPGDSLSTIEDVRRWE